MLVTRLVVAQQAFLYSRVNYFRIKVPPVLAVRFTHFHRELQRIEGKSNVAISNSSQKLHAILRQFGFILAKSAFSVGKSTIGQLAKMVDFQRLKNVNLHAREERRVDLEGGVLRRCTD